MSTCLVPAGFPAENLLHEKLPQEKRQSVGVKIRFPASAHRRLPAPQHRESLHLSTFAHSHGILSNEPNEAVSPGGNRFARTRHPQSPAGMSHRRPPTHRQRKPLEGEYQILSRDLIVSSPALCTSESDIGRIHVVARAGVGACHTETGRPHDNIHKRGHVRSYTSPQARHTPHAASPRQ